MPRSLSTAIRESACLTCRLVRHVPGISGTLAFDQLDLRSFLAAFTPFTPGSGSVPGAIDVAFAEKYNLDIRLSAAKATAGDFSFANVAATAQVKGDLTAFDISDATIFGGTVQAGLRYDRKGDGGNLEMRLLASDIDTAAAAPLARSMRVVPTGKATASLMLRGPGRDWDSFLETAEGSFSASLGSGQHQRFRPRGVPRSFQGRGLLPAARGFERVGTDRPCRSPCDARRRRGAHREGGSQDRRAGAPTLRRHSLCRRRACPVRRGRPPRSRLQQRHDRGGLVLRRRVVECAIRLADLQRHLVRPAAAGRERLTPGGAGPAGMALILS